MTSLIVSTTLDVATGVIFWAAKTTTSGLYYGIKYLIYGKTEEVVDLNELQKLTLEIKSLKNEITEMKQPKLLIEEKNIENEVYLIIKQKEQNEKNDFLEPPPSYKDINQNYGK